MFGRNPEKTKAFAEEVGLDYVSFELEDKSTLHSVLRDAHLVVHTAGPFSKTSKQMVDACLETKTHYLDITGEIEVFEECAKRDKEAKDKGIVILPGVGFDVVPTDCLASMLKDQLPDATHLGN